MHIICIWKHFKDWKLTSSLKYDGHHLQKTFWNTFSWKLFLPVASSSINNFLPVCLSVCQSVYLSICLTIPAVVNMFHHRLPSYLTTLLQIPTTCGSQIFRVICQFQGHRTLCQISRFPGIFWRMHPRNSLKFGMHIYHDHFYNLFDYDHGLFICIILVQFLHSEMGQSCSFQTFSAICMSGMAWNLPCICILNTFRTVQIIVMICWFSYFGAILT